MDIYLRLYLSINMYTYLSVHVCMYFMMIHWNMREVFVLLHLRKKMFVFLEVWNDWEIYMIFYRILKIKVALEKLLDHKLLARSDIRSLTNICCWEKKPENIILGCWIMFRSSFAALLGPTEYQYGMEWFWILGFVPKLYWGIWSIEFPVG